MINDRFEQTATELDLIGGVLCFVVGAAFMFVASLILITFKPDRTIEQVDLPEEIMLGAKGDILFIESVTYSSDSTKTIHIGFLNGS